MKFSVCLIVVLVFVLTHQVFSQNYTDYKKVQRSYKVNAATSVEVINKYGTVHIVPSNNDSVQIQIVVRTKIKDPAKLKKILGNINVDFSTTAFYITMKTIFGNEKTNFISDIKDMVSKESAVKIDYTLKVPQYISLKINNKYGDIDIEDFKGKLDIKLSNGSLQANKLGNTNIIDLKFGQSTINSVGTATVNISFDAALHVKNAEQLSINSNAATLTIDKVNILKINSKRDKFVIHSVNHLYGQTYFTNLTTVNLYKEVILDTTYGSIALNPERNFSVINLNSKSTNLHLTFPFNATYRLNTNHQNSTLILPKGITNLQQKVSSDKLRTQTTGIVGGSAGSEVQITASDCDITFN